MRVAVKFNFCLVSRNAFTESGRLILERAQPTGE